MLDPDRLIAKLQTMFAGVGGSIVVSMTLVAAMMLVEIGMKGWQASSLSRLLRSGSSALTDVVSALLVLTNAGLILGTVLFFGLVYLLQTTLKQSLDLRWLEHVGPPWLAYALFIVALDFSNYWTHRWMHRFAPLWEIHKFHHCATEMTMLTALRDHPMERALLHGVNAVPAALLGMPAEHYIAAQLALQALGFAKHSNWHSNWGWVGRWLIQSPGAHRLHHSNDPSHYNCNFASVFQFWDVLFGTAKHPAIGTVEGVRIGLSEDALPSGPLASMIAVVRGFYGRLLHVATR